jgi:hypothetical protein
MSGAALNMTLKSEQTLHGSANYYMQNPALNSDNSRLAAGKPNM